MDSGAVVPKQRAWAIWRCRALPGLAVVAVAMSTVSCIDRSEPVHRSRSTSISYHGFRHACSVTIRGYPESAMEPFISRDGKYLLFNTSNVPPRIPSLQFATRLDAQAFAYQGEIRGANEPNALSGTPTMDRQDNFYFVSTRSYSRSLSTIYTGHFTSGRVTGVHLVPGVSPRVRGVVDFDVEVSTDGQTLYVSVGHFDGGSSPTSASIAIFDKIGSRFTPDPAGAEILHSVNRPGLLTYAAAISTNGLELFFTEVNPAGGGPGIYRAVRSRVGRPFGQVQRVAAITGFAEAPSISADGTTLYATAPTTTSSESSSRSRRSPEPRNHRRPHRHRLRSTTGSATAAPGPQAREGAMSDGSPGIEGVGPCSRKQAQSQPITARRVHPGTSALGAGAFPVLTGLRGPRRRIGGPKHTGSRRDRLKNGLDLVDHRIWRWGGCVGSCQARPRACISRPCCSWGRWRRSPSWPCGRCTSLPGRRSG